MKNSRQLKYFSYYHKSVIFTIKIGRLLWLKSADDITMKPGLFWKQIYEFKGNGHDLHKINLVITLLQNLSFLRRLLFTTFNLLLSLLLFSVPQVFLRQIFPTLQYYSVSNEDAKRGNQSLKQQRNECLEEIPYFIAEGFSEIFPLSKIYLTSL